MSLADDSQLSPVLAAADELVESDLGCMQCGYNLRTRRASEQCPECGCAVGASIHFRASLACWVKRPRLLRAGLLVMAAWLVLCVPSYLLMNLLWTWRSRPAGALMGPFFPNVLVNEVAGPLCIIVGIVMVLSSLGPDILRRRGWLMACAATWVLYGTISSLLVLAIFAGAGGWAARLYIAMRWFVYIANFLPVVLEVAAFVLLQRLARALQWQGMARWGAAIILVPSIYGLVNGILYPIYVFMKYHPSMLVVGILEALRWSYLFAWPVIGAYLLYLRYKLRSLTGMPASLA